MAQEAPWQPTFLAAPLMRLGLLFLKDEKALSTVSFLIVALPRHTHTHTNPPHTHKAAHTQNHNTQTHTHTHRRGRGRRGEGGAAAKPFITHHNSLNIPLYMRIANELYLKRLIVGGFNGVFEFAKDFRNEGMDRTHNPEFTNLEFYVAYKDYNWMMSFTEKLLENVAIDCNGKSIVEYGDKQIEFKGPYKKIGIIDAIKEETGIDALSLNESELRVAAQKIGIEIDDTMGKGKIIDEIFGEKCESKFIQPTFIIDYPKEMSPLTKQHRDNPLLTERFELLINGSEKYI